MDDKAPHPWFKPLWRRVLIVAIPAAVAAWDLYHGNYGWVLVFGGLAAYAAYVFFIAWNRNGPGDDADTKQ